MILDEISTKAKKRTDQRVYNRVFKKGDLISNKTGGFNMVKPCPSRFIAEIWESVRVREWENKDEIEFTRY